MGGAFLVASWRRRSAFSRFRAEPPPAETLAFFLIELDMSKNKICASYNLKDRQGECQQREPQPWSLARCAWNRLAISALVKSLAHALPTNVTAVVLNYWPDFFSYARISRIIQPFQIVLFNFDNNTFV